MDYLKKVSRDWVITIVLFLTLATVGFTSITSSRTAEEAKKISTSNQAFLVNFSSFMQCLVVNDKEVVTALGVETYFNECNKLLFRGTGLEPAPITKVTAPPTTTTTTG